MEFLKNAYTKLKDIFSKKKDNKEKDDLDVIIDQYMKNKFINVAIVPDFIERNIYRSVIQELFKNIDKMSVHFSIFTLRTKTNLRKGTANWRKNRKCKVDYTYVKGLAKSFVNREKLDLFAIPKHVELKLYTNILILISSLVFDTIQCTTLDILGHKVEFKINPIKDKEWEYSFKNIPKKQETDIELIVDNLLEKNNILIIPDILERHLYTNALKITYYFMSNILSELRLCFKNQQVGLNIT